MKNVKKLRVVLAIPILKFQPTSIFNSIKIFSVNISYESIIGSRQLARVTKALIGRYRACG